MAKYYVNIWFLLGYVSLIVMIINSLGFVGRELSLTDSFLRNIATGLIFALGYLDNILHEIKERGK
jgi:hypothetical protein